MIKFQIKINKKKNIGDKMAALGAFYGILLLVIKRAPLLKVRYDQTQFVKTIKRLRKPIRK